MKNSPGQPPAELLVKPMILPVGSIVLDAKCRSDDSEGTWQQFRWTCTKKLIPCGKNLKTTAALWGTLQCHCRRLGAGSTEKPDAMVSGAMSSKIGNGCGGKTAVITGQCYLCQHRVGWVQADGYLYDGCSDACNQLQCAVEGCPIYMVQKITGWKVQWHAYGAAAAGPWQGQSACQVDDPIEIEERPVDVYGAFCRGGPLKWS